MLEFLCIDLHNQCNNVINQCYFNFCIVVYNGAEHIIAWFFYGLTLIHLTDPLRQVIQIVCVICGIYELLIYIYIHIREKDRAFVMFYYVLFFLEGWKEHALHELFRAHTRTEFGCRKWKNSLNPDFSLHHELSVSLNTSGAQEWLSMGSIKVTIS